MDATGVALLEWLKPRRQEMLEQLLEWVEIESPSTDKAAVDRLGHRVADAFVAAGAHLKRLRADPAPDSWLLEFGGTAGERPILLLGHLDTVYPSGTLRHMPFRVAGERVYGPGVLDMKGGLVAALFARRALAGLGLESTPVRCLWVGDEETGSRGCRRWIEEQAPEARCVLVLEPGNGLEGAAKTARKGIAFYRIQARGRAAHAGVDFAAGASAVLEIAHLLQEVAGWTDLAAGVTVNPGVVAGGTRANVVAAEAMAEIDLRAPAREQLEALDARLRARVQQPRVAGVELRLEGGINRPPMEPSAGGLALFEAARTVAAGLAIELRASATGGGSDGNFTAALGVATLDGLGMVGEGAHSPQEAILAEALVQRSALLAALLRPAVLP